MSSPKGLTYINDLLSQEVQAELVKYLVSPERKWSPVGQGPHAHYVQQYGYYYDYSSHSVRTSPIEPIPGPLIDINRQLCDQKILSSMHNQMIVNFYSPGQGITAHRDSVQYFGDEIATISLVSAAIMEFASPTGCSKYEQYLAPGSIAILRDDAQWQWTHSIPARKSDKVNGKIYPRSDRISITYRSYMQPAQV
jgi:alkylated DNA repair dioxygenase AlkB